MVFPDGRPDSNFNGNGKIRLPFSPLYENFNDLALQNDGKILLAGNTIDSNKNWSGFLVVRLNANGSVDSTFGTNGRATTIFGFTSFINAIALESDGKIVAVGISTTDYNGFNADSLAIAIYNTDGSPDNAFNGDGKLTFIPLNYHNQINNGAWGNSVLVQPDGKIVVGGTFNYTQSHGRWFYSDFAIWRFNTNGAPDNTFNGNGIQVITRAFTTNAVTNIALECDGRIVVSGNTGDIDFLSSFITLSRVNNNGIIDSSFGTGGNVVLYLKDSVGNAIRTSAASMALRNQRIYIGGYGDGQSNLSAFKSGDSCFHDFIVPAQPGIHYANREFNDSGGWTNYYYDNKTPGNHADDTLLLSLRKNGQDIGTIGDETFAVMLEATAAAGSNSGILLSNPLITNPSGYWVMNRYWKVTTTREPTSDVGVRFYYNNQDLADVNGSYPLHNLTNQQLIFYKTVDGDPDPARNLTGSTAIISIMPGTTASNDTSWTYHQLTDNTQFAEFSVSGFSGGGGGGTVNGLPLPLSLISFTANYRDGSTWLYWQTASEQNSSHFDIERSIDGINFLSIGNVIAAGNSSFIKNYDFNDQHSQKGVNYYRLKMVDVDGKYNFSKFLK